MKLFKNFNGYFPAFIASIFILSLVSCEGIVDGLNENPNNPANASASLLLTGLELGNIAFHEGHSAGIAGIWSGYFTGMDREYKTQQDYVVSGSDFTAPWNYVYQGVFIQEKLLEERAAQVNNRLLIGIARILKAHAAGTATALWGDIPYTQAADIERFPNPVYDPQKTVYDSVQVLLDHAIEDLSSGIGTSPAAADIHFGGNSANWLKVAHTLKARFYLDVRNYQKAYEEAEKGISAQAGSLLAPHGNSTGNLNFYSYNRSLTDLTSESAYLPKVLDPAHANYKGNAKTNETARLNYYFTYQTSGTAKTKFIPNTTNTSALVGIFAQNASFALVTYQENLLILAEAAFRTQGFEQGLKKLNEYRAYLNSGGYLSTSYKVPANFKYEPYVSADFEAGGIAGKPSLTADQSLLREILLERYVAFFGQQTAFNDLRRTRNEPSGVVVPPNIGTVLPERFVYSQTETNSNTNAPSPIPSVFEVTTVNK